jgi:hypothetical protein
MLQGRILLRGPTEIRTPDILLAKQALYQLSYRPVLSCVETEGFEPSTFCLPDRCYYR